MKRRGFQFGRRGTRNAAEDRSGRLRTPRRCTIETLEGRVVLSATGPKAGDGTTTDEPAAEVRTATTAQGSDNASSGSSESNGLLDKLVENRVKELVKEWFTDVLEKVDRLPNESYDSLSPKEWVKDAVTELSKGATDKAIDLLPGSEDLTAGERSGLKKGMEAIIDGLANGAALPHEKLLELIVGAGETVIDVWNWTEAEKENPTFRFPSTGGGPTGPLPPIVELTAEELCILTGCAKPESTTPTNQTPPSTGQRDPGNQGSSTTTDQT